MQTVLADLSRAVEGGLSRVGLCHLRLVCQAESSLGKHRVTQSLNGVAGDHKNPGRHYAESQAG